MILKSLRLLRYDLPLKRPIVIGVHILSRREGYLVAVHDDQGAVGYGETSPLPGYSDESLNDIGEQFNRLTQSVIGKNPPNDIVRLNGCFESWLGPLSLSPSVRFGFETALMLLTAYKKNLTLANLLSDSPRRQLTVNALLDGSHDEVLSRSKELLTRGYRSFKLKVGRRSVESDAATIRAIREAIGPDSSLRLDANRGWTKEQLLRLWDSVRDCNIEYIEEPLASFDELLTLPGEIGLPLALDESLRTVGIERVSDLPNLKALVLKPTVLGLEKAVRLARSAVRKNLTAVVSSTYESGFGISLLALIASALTTEDIPVGLDTQNVFQSDLVETQVVSSDGRIVIADLADPVQTLNLDCLREVEIVN